MGYGGEPGNGITAVPEFLDRPNVKGDRISIAAAGCRRDRAAKRGEKGADQALPVKENRPAVYRETNGYFEYAEEGRGRNPPADVGRSGIGKKNHGRQASREVLPGEDLSRLKGKAQGKDPGTMIVYRRCCVENGKPTVDSR
jgi:hypothetical protein